MTPEREQLIRESWILISQSSAEASELFYGRLFELDPAARAMFAHVDLERQGSKFMAMLGSIIGCIDRAPDLVSGAAALGRRHAAYGVQAEQFESVGAALIWMLERVLGPAFTPEMRAAWVEAYGLIAAVMKRASAAATPVPPR